MASMLIKFDGVEGESQQEDFNGWTEVKGFNMTSSAPPSTDLGGGSGVGKPTIHGVSFKTVSGRHTPQINKKYLDGKHFTTVTIVFLKQTGEAKPQKYYELTMDHVFVTSMGKGKEDGSLGSESITLLAENYKEEYWAQASDGSITSVGSTSYNTKKGLSA